MEIPLVGGAARGRSSNISPETCINWFYEKTGNGEALVPTPGATLFSSPGTGEVRGGIEYNGKAYFVVGSTLYEIDSNGTATSKGTLGTSQGRISMVHNGVLNELFDDTPTKVDSPQQIVIADGVNGYIYDNLTDTFSVHPDVDFPASCSLAYMDGYIIIAEKGSNRFWLTDRADASIILGGNTGDFASATGWPDNVQTILADRRELYIFGETTLEVWYNAGDTDNTFQRFQGGFSEVGCASPFTPTKFDNSIIWLTKNDRGQGFVAILADAYQPKIISTPEVNYQISTYSRIDDAFGYAYQQEGHEFYVLTFPTAKVTWVYDAATQIWHQRAHTIDGVFPNRERYNCSVFAMGKHLAGDLSNGNIYEIDPTEGQFNGVRIPRERITANLTDEEKRIPISSVHLDMEEGIGDPNEDDTSIWLSYSKDGGHTYTDEVERSAGEVGEYAKRLVWRRLGIARNWIFRIRTWSPQRPLLKGMYARLYGEE